MDQNYQTPQTNYAPAYVQPPVAVPSVDQMVAELSDKAFGKALASAILSGFPIGSIIAIVLGSKALNLVDHAKKLAEPYGIFGGGKYIAARILALVGKISGIIMTVIWPFYLIYFIAMFGFLLSAM